MDAFMRTRVVKAVRKVHQCGWCGEKIDKGCSAISRAYVFEGAFNSDHTHPECFRAMVSSPDGALREGWYVGEFNRGEKAEEYR